MKKSDLFAPPLAEACIDISDNCYPELLKNIYDPPKKLFFKGNKKLLYSKKLLTIVGSRKTTNYHQETLKNIIAGFKGTPLIIVSGLAIGIDGLAHRYALDNGLATIAVLGSSLDENRIYPKENLPLAREILSKGGLLLSEQEPETQTQLWHFPKRNRILAGLSKVTVVISGAKKSGTLITAQIAVDQGRDVVALPANINLKLSYGPNDLIKNGAHLLTGANDILRLYDLEIKPNNKPINFENKIYAKTYSILQTESLSLIKLSDQLQLSMPETTAIVSELELMGLVKINKFNQVEII